MRIVDTYRVADHLTINIWRQCDSLIHDYIASQIDDHVWARVTVQVLNHVENQVWDHINA